MRPTAVNTFYLGWTMVFKAVGGVERNVYEVYESNQTSSEDEVEALNVTNKYRDHYKNRIVLAWQAFDASEVLSNKCCNHPSHLNRDHLNAKPILNNLKQCLLSLPTPIP